MFYLYKALENQFASVETFGTEKARCAENCDAYSD